MRRAAAILLVALLGSGAAVGGEKAPPPWENAILDSKASYWRVFMGWKTAKLVTKGGKIRPLRQPRTRRRDGPLKRVPVVRSEHPPADWMRPEFDDSHWARKNGPYGPVGGRRDSLWVCGNVAELNAICLRGKFQVNDPKRARDVQVYLEYYGGVVVYCNGVEVARQNMPKGKIDFDTPATPYPLEAYIRPDGKLLHEQGDRNERDAMDQREYLRRFALRTRVLEVLVKPELLRKGVNVVAIEVHRAPINKIFVTGKHAARADMHPSGPWVHARVMRAIVRSGWGLTLKSVAPRNTRRPEGVQVWTTTWPLRRLSPADYGDPCEPLRPITMAGVRNGAFTGRVVVGSTETLYGVKARAGDLRSKEGGVIAAKHVEIRYSLATGPVLRLGKHTARSFKALVPAPPEHVEVNKGWGGALLPIWATVHVPANAKPGRYEGSLTIEIGGQDNRTIRVPIRLKVHRWTLPNPEDFVTVADMVQSPESVALWYKVPFWSDRHFALMEKSFEQIAKIGARVIYLPMICRSNLGNSESMVRWIKKKDGGWEHDFTVWERYLDLAHKHMKKPHAVILIIWDYYTGVYQMYKPHLKTKSSIPHWDTVLFDVLDPKTGKVTETEGPGYDVKPKEAEAFWTPVLHQAREKLRKRGLDKVMMIGMFSDSTAGKKTVAMFRRMLPTAKLARASHPPSSAIHGTPVGYMATIWGPYGPVDPNKRRMHGWQRSNLYLQFDRPRYFRGPLAYYHVRAEWNIAGRQRGFGRKGADFWDVLGGKFMYPINGRLSSGRYPQSHWANRNIYEPDWLAPGPDGAVSSVLFEMARDGVQQCEARVFLEKALLDKARRDKIGDALAARCQKILDERTRIAINAYYRPVTTPLSDKLFGVAADVAEALGGE